MGQVGAVETSRAAWESIGQKLPSPHLGCPAFIQSFDHFAKVLPANGRVLDLGCGIGAVARLLVAQGFDVFGIDFAEAMIAAARTAVPEATFVQQSMLDISFDGEFDGVLASYSLLGLTPSQFDLVAGKIARALKPGGATLIALNEPDAGEDQDGSSISEIGGHSMYSRTYSEAEVRRAFSSLEVLSVERGIVSSDFYGDERCLCVLMAKT